MILELTVALGCFEFPLEYTIYKIKLYTITRFITSIKIDFIHILVVVCIKGLFYLPDCAGLGVYECLHG